MKTHTLKINGINENNLLNVDLEIPLHQITLLKGKSGSGKSSLAFTVLAKEAARQKKLTEKTEDLFYYCIRPDFKHSDKLPLPEVISQKGVGFNYKSNFGISTGVESLLKKAFIEYGEIKQGDEIVVARNLSQIRAFQTKYHPNAKIYYQLSFYDFLSSKAKQIAGQYQKNLFARNEKSKKLKKIEIKKLSGFDEKKYEVFVEIVADLQDLNTNFPIILIGPDNEINFSIYTFALSDGQIYRLPSNFLFSTSTQSSLSGCCFECQATGFIITIKFNQFLEKNTPLEKGFISLPLQSSGRYKGLKYLPANLLKEFTKLGANIKQSFNAQSEEIQAAILDLMTNKLLANKQDSFVQTLLEKEHCAHCQGTKLSAHARKVTIDNKSIDFYYQLKGFELLSLIKNKTCFDNRYFGEIKHYLDCLSELSLDHIAFDRKTETLSSGEKQRCKIIPLILNHSKNALIIIDEPSSNLHYQDNLKLFKAILRLKHNKNTVVIVEHNPLYEEIADKIYLVENGQLSETQKIARSLLAESFTAKKRMTSEENAKLRLRLPNLRNIQLNELSLPKNKITAIVGASGTGKSTLSRDLIYAELLNTGHKVEYIGAELPKGNITSILATYIGIFDKIRDYFAKSAEGKFSNSDFSFNSTGACPKCDGTGEVENHTCNQCFGSRFKTDIKLYKHQDLSLPQLLALPITELTVHKGLTFLTPVIKILEKLSLSHLSLDRRTSTLSGGELQRVKLAKFFLENTKKNTEQVIILDEPCKGLDSTSISKLLFLLEELQATCSLIIIEHNPFLIYQADFIIDLGLEQGIKNSQTILMGFGSEKKFPSLNHAQLVLNLKKIVLDYKVSDLKTLIKNEPALERNSNPERYELIAPLYKNQDNFALEHQFSKSFTVSVPDKNIDFYHSLEDLKKALSKFDKFYFNPFFVHLDKYSKLPHSIKMQVMKEYKINDSTLDEWSIILPAESLEHAIYCGSGMAIVKENGKVHYHGIRVLSLIDKVFDRVYPQKSVFNLYKNSCEYCHGYTKFKSYPLNDWVNETVDICHKSSFSLPIYKILPKTSMKYFEKEKLFEFSKAIKEMTKEEKNILFYGFRNMKFLKPKGNKNVDSDHYEWRGINSYIYNNVNKISKNINFNDNLAWIDCPFCEKGFKKSIRYYHVNGESFVNKAKLK